MFARKQRTRSPGNCRQRKRQHIGLVSLRPATGAPTLSNQVEQISVAGAIFAIIVRAEFRREGINFFTENTLSQQLAFMRHPAGKVIEPHVHNPVRREVQFTQEALFIRKGRLRVDFYDSDQCYLESRVLDAGDVILLIQGGHGFQVLEEVEMIEVKQGPYLGECDKTRFAAIDPSRVRLPERWPLRR